MRVLLSSITILCLLTVTAAQQTSSLDPVAANAAGATGFAGAESKALDEMLLGRSGHHNRWMERPSLVVVLTVMQFRAGQPATYEALDREITRTDAQWIADDLNEGLALLTAGAFDRFASISFERAKPGAAVDVDRDGVIVAGRFAGVTKTLKAAGFGGRVMRADHTITSGSVILDEDYDRSGSRRRLLRIHELGHALGYNHVQSQRSIMNPVLGSEATDFDRRVFTIAFQDSAATVPAP